MGILVGTASVVAMVLGGELATNEALKQFKTLGTDLLALSLSQNTDKDNPDVQSEPLLIADVQRLTEVDPNILTAAPYTQVYSQAQFNGHDIGGNVVGVTEDFAELRIFKCSPAVLFLIWMKCSFIA